MHAEADSVYAIVPSFNEDGKVLSNVVHELRSAGFPVVLVNDGSLNFSFQELDGVYLLHHHINLGQGAALQTGMEAALQCGAKYLVHFDADGQHSVSDISKALSYLQVNKLDIVFGTRFRRGSENESIPLSRKILLLFARKINFLFTGVLLSDAHNGFRILNRNAAQNIVITQNRMAHATEIVANARKQKMRFAEFPVSIEYTQYSKSKGQRGLDAITILFDLIAKKFIP